MQKAQNRTVRAILKCDRYTPIRSMLDALNFMNIKLRMTYNVCVLVHKIKYKLMPKYLIDELKAVREGPMYNTRQKKIENRSLQNKRWTEVN